jgi:hypothetical protein
VVYKGRGLVRRLRDTATRFLIRNCAELCPLRVKSGSDALKFRCPLYPRKRTFLGAIRMSALGHEQTYAVQQGDGLFDHRVGKGEQLVWNGEAERAGRWSLGRC